MNIKITLKYSIIFTFTILNVTIALETVDELCENSPIGTRIPHPENCNLFLECTSDNDQSFALVISCQHNLFFNPNTLECDPNYESEICPKPITSPTIKKNTTTKRKTKKTTTFRTKTTRSTQKKTKQSDTSTTDTAIISTTNPDDNGDLSTTVNSNNGIDCPEIDSKQAKFLENHEDCSKYYMCYHGRALPLKCWNGLHFSMRHMTCTPPEIAKCSANKSPYPKCPIFGRALLPHPEKCRLFFFCTNGIKIIQQCGSFDYWDINEKKCKRQSEAICYSENKMKMG